MRDALDEVALEWRTTRSAVMRELIAHALKSPPKRRSER
jgi:predicted transcriptional regulator